MYTYRRSYTQFMAMNMRVRDECIKPFNARISDVDDSLIKRADFIFIDLLSSELSHTHCTRELFAFLLMYYKPDDDIMDNKSEDNSGFAELQVCLYKIHLLNFIYLRKINK